MYIDLQIYADIHDGKLYWVALARRRGWHWPGGGGGRYAVGQCRSDGIAAVVEQLCHEPLVAAAQHVVWISVREEPVRRLAVDGPTIHPPPVAYIDVYVYLHLHLSIYLHLFSYL